LEVKENRMEIYDLLNLSAEGYENRNVNVFFQNDLFKTRVIALEPGGKVPECRMESYVLFYVVRGEVLLNKNGESSPLREGQVFISEPARISMESQAGARLMGVQIKTQNVG
jgi:quercetin dioxygenase-like cupin family protein